MWQLGEREREKGCAQTAQLTPLEMRLDVQLSETCEPLKCRYFRQPQGVTYAKGATATTTKTKCTCHTTTTHACTLPSFMPQLSKVSTYVCVTVCVSVCVLLVFAKHFAGIHLPVVVATLLRAEKRVLSLITYATMCINFKHAICILLIRPVVQRPSKVAGTKVVATKCCTFDFNCKFVRPLLPRIIDVYFCTLIGYYLQ